VTWAPGTLAKVTFEGKEYVAFWDDCNEQWVSSTLFRLYANDRHPVTDVRPLVVLDPEDRDQMVTLHETLSGTKGVTWHGWPEILRDVLRRYAEAQTKPPKPPEPRGLGAVVEDAEGQVWVRFKTAEIRPWRRNWPGYSSFGAFFRDIDAVKVLSEGVTP